MHLHLRYQDMLRCDNERGHRAFLRRSSSFVRAAGRGCCYIHDHDAAPIARPLTSNIEPTSPYFLHRPYLTMGSPALCASPQTNCRIHVQSLKSACVCRTAFGLHVDGGNTWMQRVNDVLPGEPRAREGAVAGAGKQALNTLSASKLVHRRRRLTL
ncbi:hypothetical protein MVEN_00680300 [Mycena venus]|uniref:Uncharacterized protein n=1 Tax=Mycena venus TaxID=2733690 RepID=A0A8H6YJS8_9AGAR|nr:hypothetical protein MVEN_00680300 [Mycena venus]